MAIAKKGSRRIVVDTTAYRWTIRPRPTYSQGLVQSLLSFAVELEDGGRTTLLVTVNAARPDNWMMTPGSVIHPSVVERAIREALNQGWRPEETGSAFQLTVRTADDRREAS